ncbi:hypothetical protein JQN72_01085 [Phycicoccus sp. CSK15P-2]|uniref:hypothetical protein n=1 Tax=Phycicoccus sp. CSK15P-2 TaxID=2807627 RepID=UPI0019519E72|nr:hypothetical protein [Phycicoccus sp. CSK15P-2]MBM6402839.1 hypothetical protein [Phycicoccus sp. CSK15P-2]
MSTIRRIAAAAAAAATATTITAVGMQPAAASDFDTCDLSTKVDELRAWDTNDEYNIIVWKDSSFGSADLHGVAASGSEGKIACGFTNEVGHYHWAVFDYGEFWRDGDGGYRNWAFYGSWDRPEDTHVIFHDR